MKTKFQNCEMLLWFNLVIKILKFRREVASHILD